MREFLRVKAAYNNISIYQIPEDTELADASVTIEGAYNAPRFILGNIISYYLNKVTFIYL